MKNLKLNKKFVKSARGNCGELLGCMGLLILPLSVTFQ